MTHRVLKLLAIALLLCLSPLQAHASTKVFYISFSTGNDSNTGTTTASPWKTLAKVQSAITASPNGGVQFLFLVGDTWTWTGASGAPMLSDTHSLGSASNRLIFSSYGTGNAPIFDGGNGLASSCFFIEQTGGAKATLSNVTISSIECRNTSQRGVYFHQTTGGSAPLAGMVVNNMYVHNTGPGAFTGATKGPTGPTNNACSNSPPGGPAPCDDGNNYDQIEFSDESLKADGAQIVNNKVSFCGGHGCIEMDGDTGSPLVQGNTASDYVNAGIDIEKSSGVIVSNNTVSQTTLAWATPSLLYSNAGATYAGSISWYNNFVYGSKKGIECEGGGSTFTSTCNAYNNTLYLTGTFPGVTTDATSLVSWDIRNNIFDTAAPIGVCGSTSTNTCNQIANWDYNDNGGKTGGAPTVSGLTGMSSLAANDKNNVDPMYNNVAGNVFTLQSTSMLLNAGDASLFSITQNANMGADATITGPTPTPTPRPTPTPSGTPVPTPTPTPVTVPATHVDMTLRDLHASRSVGIAGGSGLGDYVKNLDVNDFINPKAYGAKCDGTTDDSAAFTAAMGKVNSFGQSLLIPVGKCLVNSTLTITRDGAGIIGYGDTLSTLTTSSASLPQIKVSAPNWTLARFSLTRSVTATGGGYGIQATVTAANPVVENVHVSKAYKGFSLLSAYYGRITDIEIDRSISDGLFITNTDATAPLQWLIRDAISEFNGGHGFIISATAATNGAPWSQIYTFANSGFGIAITDTVLSVADNQINGWTASANCQAAIYLNNVSATTITNGFEEGSGGDPFTSCPTPPPFYASGILLTAGNYANTIASNLLQGNRDAGVYDNAAGNLDLSGNLIRLNGNSGILFGSTADMDINGGFSDANGEYGIRISGSGRVFMSNLICNGNTLGARAGQAANILGNGC